MAAGQIDLLTLFKQVSKSVKKEQTTLNKADTYNHDHGDHMVEIFDVVTQAMKAKKNAQPADQLEYAAQLLRSKTGSGSAKVYASGLEQAAKQVLGKELNAATILSIVQALMGSAQQPGQKAGGGDMPGSLMGSLMGGSAGSNNSADGGDMLGSLVGSLLGGSAGAGSASKNGGEGLDLSDVLGSGINYMSAKQSGKSNIEALTGALLSGSAMAETPYRAQSGEVVTSALLGALGSMLKK